MYTIACAVLRAVWEENATKSLFYARHGFPSLNSSSPPLLLLPKKFLDAPVSPSYSHTSVLRICDVISKHQKRNSNDAYRVAKIGSLSHATKQPHFNDPSEHLESGE